MASKISSDISSNVDISCRKGDSFYLEATMTNDDGSVFDLQYYSVMQLVVTNSNGSTYLKLQKSGSVSDSSPPLYFGQITSVASTGVITIEATSTMMEIPAASYSYYLMVSNGTLRHTILHGKFKVIS